MTETAAVKHSSYASVRERSRSLRERSNGLRADSKQLREVASKIHPLVVLHQAEPSAAPRPARSERLPSGSQPIMSLISLTFDRVRKAREEAEVTRETASELRKEAELFRSRARKMSRASC